MQIYDEPVDWYLALCEARRGLADADLAALHAWQAEDLGNRVDSGEFDWPGWASLIGDEPGIDLIDRGPAPDPDYISAALRQAVLERDGHACRHCGDMETLSMDHIIPRSRGGPTTYENLQTLCRSCNSRKGARMPVDA